MPTRREFMGLAARLASSAGVVGGCLESIARAIAIEPAAGSSYLDAEHIVILVQENRAFDHVFGTLRGVRGFNDPRAITLRSGDRDYADMPLTLGYYTRADLPFYYALADAFTICDQYFCSSLTGTTPNRCYLWTGTIRERPTAAVPANVRNEEINYDCLAGWPTFPERLEDHGVSWKVYQNEISIDSGLHGEEDDWLANFTDNPLEFFRQYQVRLIHAPGKAVRLLQ